MRIADGPMSTPRRPAPRSIGKPMTPIFRRFLAMTPQANTRPNRIPTRARVADWTRAARDAIVGRRMIAPLPRTAATMASIACAALMLGGGAVDNTRFAVPPTPPHLHRLAQNVLFVDDFTGDPLHGWKPDQPGVWSVWHGLLRADLPDQKQLRSILVTGDTTWTDVAVD